MISTKTKADLSVLTEQQITTLKSSNDIIIVSFEPVEPDFSDYISQHAFDWIGNEKIKAIDTRRFFENLEWQAPMLTSDFLPKTILINTKLWDHNSFKNLMSNITIDLFYKVPAVHLDYNDAFEFVFSFSTYYHYTMISVTDFCNLRCRGCSFHGEDPSYGFSLSRDHKIKQELKQKDYDRFLEQTTPGESVLFCGTGELFVSKKAMPYLREAIKHKLHVRILTNGMLVTPELSEELVDLGVEGIIFSIDGHTKQLVESIRVGADFDTIIGNLKHLIAARDIANSNMIIGVQSGWFDGVRQKKNEILTYWKNFGVDTFTFFAEQVDWYKVLPIFDDKVMPINSHACFVSLNCPVLMTDGYVAPCTANFQADWSSRSSAWMQHIQELPFKEIIRNYRKMRLDPKSDYRKRCALCHGKLSTYSKLNTESAYSDAYRFTDRVPFGEAAGVKLLPQREEKIGDKMFNKIKRIINR